jgi:hypothetical protein
MPSVTFDVPDGVWAELQRIAPPDAIPQLAQAALREWAAWLSGAFRPMSMSELETERIFALYNSVLTDELPSVNDLGQRFGLPMGRARYIVQSLAYRHGRFVQERQIRAILAALDEGRWSDDHSTVVIVVDRSSANVIDRTLSDLLADKRVASIVRSVATAQGQRYDLGSNHHKVLKEAFERQLRALQ